MVSQPTVILTKRAANEETLFYLTSRGIKESEARNLVSLGKINYLIEEVRDEKIKEDLLKLMIKGV